MQSPQVETGTFCIKNPFTKTPKKPNSNWSCQPCTSGDHALRGYHDEVSHLGLKHMLNMMMWLFPLGLRWLSKPRNMLLGAASVSPSRQSNSELPWKILWPPMLLELVHIDYLCMEPGKGKEENVLVVTDHFTCYTQVYVTQSQMAQENGQGFLGQLHCLLLGYLRRSSLNRGEILEANS